MFVVQNRIKEHNLTFLEHKQTRKQYLLKENTFKEEIEQLDRLSKLKTRQSFTSPFLTNLVSTLPLLLQNTNITNMKIFVRNIIRSIVYGNTLLVLLLMISMTVL